MGTRRPVRFRVRALSTLSVLAAGVYVLVAPPARAEVVDHVGALTRIAAFEDYAAWSRYDGQRFGLVIWHDGAIEQAKVASRLGSFDVDLGRDAAGRVVAVYSRCSWTQKQGVRGVSDPGYNRGCDLYKYDVATGTESELRRPSKRATSEFLPAISGHRLVFARQTAAARRHRGLSFPSLVSASLGRRYREQMLPRPKSHPTTDPYTAAAQNLGPTTLDIAGNLAVVGWQYETGESIVCVEPGRDIADVVLYDLTTRSRRLLGDGCTPNLGFFASPSLDGDSVFFKSGLGDVRRFLVGSDATIDKTLTPDQLLLSTQTAGGWTWAVIQNLDVDGSVTIERVPPPTP